MKTKNKLAQFITEKIDENKKNNLKLIIKNKKNNRSYFLGYRK